MPIASGSDSGPAATAPLISSASSAASTWEAKAENADRFTSPSDVSACGRRDGVTDLERHGANRIEVRPDQRHLDADTAVGERDG